MAWHWELLKEANVVASDVRFRGRRSTNHGEGESQSAGRREGFSDPNGITRWSLHQAKDSFIDELRNARPPSSPTSSTPRLHHHHVPHCSHSLRTKPRTGDPTRSAARCPESDRQPLRPDENIQARIRCAGGQVLCFVFGSWSGGGDGKDLGSVEELRQGMAYLNDGVIWEC